MSMMNSAELYPILVFYANKNKSPYIAVPVFLDFLGKTAKRYCVSHPAWTKWLNETESKFRVEMSTLIEEGKCEFISDDDDSHIFMPNYYPDLINNAYMNAEGEADLPFPNEESMGIMLPGNQSTYISSANDFISVLDKYENNPTCIVKINFSDDFGSAITLATMIPRQLVETAILKARNYIQRYGNKEYTFHKLALPLQGKESFLKKQFENILTKPLDVYNDIKEGRELSYIFWAHFCVLVKNDIKKKQEHLPADIAAFQSFSIIETINGYYRANTTKQRETEQAFKILESSLARPPYLHPMGRIMKFTDTKEKLLLGQYTSEELEVWLRKQTRESENSKLPNLLVFKSSAIDDTCFILKDKFLSFCARLLLDARMLVSDTILKQWARLVLDYKSEPAMEDDAQFEKELYNTGKKLCPDLMNLLTDPRLFLVYQEAEKSPNGIPSSLKIFSQGEMLPYSSLFSVSRNDMLRNVKAVLPFWYSVPALFAVIGFFKRLFQKGKNVKELPKEMDSEEEIVEEGSRAGEIKTVAQELGLSLIPAGHTMDSYLTLLQERWSRIIDRKARENLIMDVNFLARDCLRRTLKIQKQFKLSHETISDMAFNLVSRSKALSSLSARDSLLLYLELYMIKLMGNVKTR